MGVWQTHLVFVLAVSRFVHQRAACSVLLVKQMSNLYAFDRISFCIHFMILVAFEKM